jgi:mRNA interferase MazF
MSRGSFFPCRGDVVEVVLDPTIGTEIRKTQPCVVISNDRANEFSPQLTVVPITAYSPKKAAIPVCVAVPAGKGGLAKRSIINCSQIWTVDKQRVRGAPLGTLPASIMQKLDRALKIHLALSP